VFRAYDPARDRLVAVKSFKLDLPPERAHQLVAELERLIAAGLGHPSIVAPLAAGIDGVVPYLAQEYVAAESLDIVLRQPGGVPAADALRVAIGLSAALDAAAAAGVDHGVLHPRDVLLSADDTRLTGLGIARALERVGVPTPVRRPYTAPERSVGSPWDRRADVFGLAALVYEMLCARRLAGTGDEAAGSLFAIKGVDLKQLRVVFARALAADPAQRFDTAREFAGALGDAFGQPAAAGAIRNARPRPDRTEAGVRGTGLRLDVIDNVEPRLPLEPTVDDVALHENGRVEDIGLTLAAPVAVAGRSAPEDAPLHAETPGAEPLLLRSSPGAPVADPPDAYRLAADEGPREESRTSISPLAFALLIGAALGFAAGFGVGARGKSAEPDAVAADASREFTEGAVGAKSGAPGERGENVLRPDANPQPAPPGAAADGKATDSSTPDARTARAAGAAALLKADERDARRQSEQTTGSLLVRSTPIGARVFVDNREFGRTPITVRPLARGSHVVRVTREGYVADERQVTISSTQRAHSVTVRLSAERPVPAKPVRPPAGGAAGTAETVGTSANAKDTTATTGVLSVESRPPGARVFIDGQLAGITPLVVRDVTAGDHAVHLDRDGYTRWSSAVRIVASAANRITASLDR
jgi:hypothetical protein